MLFTECFLAYFSLSIDIHLSIGNDEHFIEFWYSLVGGKDTFLQFFWQFGLHLFRPMANKKQTCFNNIQMIDIVDL